MIHPRSDKSLEKMKKGTRELLLNSVATGTSSLGSLKQTLKSIRAGNLNNSSPLIFILPSSARTEPLKSTLAVSWMKFPPLHPFDRRRFVLWLRELLRVLWFYCPPDDCSHNGSAFAHTFDTCGHKKHSGASKVQRDAVYFPPNPILCTVCC